MKFIKCLKHAFNMVVHSKIRSWLTIIGIVIGVSAVIAIMSIGEGMQESMEEQMGGLGSDILTITAGFSRGGSMFGGGGGEGGGPGGGGEATEEEVVLSRTDLQALRGIPDIALIDTEIRGNVDVSYLGKSGSVSLTGVDQKVWSQITTLEIKEGRMLDSADQNVVVIGGGLASSYFDQPIGINKMITIEENVFRVVGILDDNSRSIYMPIQMAYQVLEDKENDVYDSIVVKIKDENNLDAVIEKIENKLMIVRHVTEKEMDFSISSSKQMQETRSEMMSSMNSFLVAIAAVSLIVGSVGVANTMFTSVLEKTKEIGIMKAIGARNKDILLIFLFNSGIIGFFGGVLGVVFGIILSGLLPTLMGESGMLRSGTFVSINSIILALSVSILVGIIAGFVPAYQASKLKPVDALRYE
ncbi:ABC transporter substrate-binding protein [Candidatus Woesearchaeota archaeon RBG_13_36_6]|nr:MAG: ABC transporter substrate-binding protein [Candidatus Woesearchaeota archaeon RBG_13_36_6]